MKKFNNVLIVLTSMLLLTGCINDSAQMKRAKRNASDVEAFNVLTNLEEEKTIHTSAQATYLAYDGDYVSIPEANYPDGQQHISEPEPVSLSWEFSVPSDKTLSRYDVVVGKEADLSDGYAMKGTTATSLNVYNSYLGDNYFKIVANYTDGTSDSSKIQKYTVENIYPRNLRIDGMTNCRDMGGGRELVDGGYIKQGLIYRTSSTNGWGNGRAVVPDTITNDGKEELLGHLGCKTEINVNNGGNTNYINIDNFVIANMWYDQGKHHLYRNAEPIKVFFHTLADQNNYPVFYHCRIGTDRTGLCAILLSGLLGVPENLIYQDYLFSNFGNIQEKRYIGEKAGRDNILNYINDLKAFPGEKFHNKVYNYLLSIGVPASELNSVIDILTEGNKASGNDNGQVLITAEDFAAEDCEMKESSTRANPAKYYTLAEGAKVTANFDPKYDALAKLVAYLGSSENSDKKIADSLVATFDGNEVEIDENITFATCGFGSGDGRTYYSAVVLGEVNVMKGYTEITIEGVANNLNIGAVSVIPVEPVNGQDVEPEVEPTPSNPTQPTKKGCGSFIATASLISLMAIGGLSILFIKRKED